MQCTNTNNRIIKRLHKKKGVYFEYIKKNLPILYYTINNVVY